MAKKAAAVAAKPDKPKRTKRAHKVPRMKTDQLRAFVDDWVSGRLFTDRDIPKGDGLLLRSVFMVIALGGLSDWSKPELDQIGLIYEHLDRREMMCINGMPTFLSMRLLHKDDWAIVRPAILAEIERRKSIPL